MWTISTSLPRSSGRQINIRAVAVKPPILPRVAQCHHDLRSDHDPNSRTHNQYDTGSDVMQVARAFVPIAPSGPSSHDPCRCAHTQKNGPGIDDRNNHEGHAAETQAKNGFRPYRSFRKHI